MKLVCVFFGLVTLLTGCSGTAKKKMTFPLPFPAIRPESPDMSGKVFFIGPKIDSVKAEIEAGCDCCASDLAFVDSTSFIYIERCLGGDVYVKGEYLSFGNILLLRTDKEYVSSEDSMPPDTVFQTTYEMGYSKKNNYIGYTLSELKGKRFITYSSEDYTEYGMETAISTAHFLKEFQGEKTLEQFLASIVSE